MKTQLIRIDSLSFFFFLSFPKDSAGITKSVGAGVDYATLKAAFDLIIAGAIKPGAITKQKTDIFTDYFGSPRSHFNALTKSVRSRNLPAVSCPALGITSREEITAYFLIK